MAAVGHDSIQVAAAAKLPAREGWHPGTGSTSNGGR